MEAFFNRVWAQRGPMAWMLWPLSLLFGQLVSLRRAGYAVGLFARRRLPVPVVVVGNVRVGGGGKSPTVLVLVRHWVAQGRKVVVVSRGHGRSPDAPAVLEVKPHMDAAQSGDEPLMLCRELAPWNVPVFVGEDRFSAGQEALRAHPGTQLIVCDDGLQHLALARDVEVIVHAASGVGNGFLLPAGPLREPWPRQADAVLDTTTCRHLEDVAADATGRTVRLDALGDTSVVAVAAIANPQAFFDMLRAKGVRPLHCVALPDHDDFSDWPVLRASWPADAQVLCTQKDSVKLWAQEPSALAVSMRLTPPADFFEALDRKLAALQGR